jgi:hypothetical protein
MRRLNMPIRNVRDAMHEMKAGSKHIKTRPQAIAVGLKAAGKSRGKKSKAEKRASKHKV